MLNQVDVALINTNQTIEVKLNPIKDSQFIEEKYKGAVVPAF